MENKAGTCWQLVKIFKDKRCLDRINRIYRITSWRAGSPPRKVQSPGGDGKRLDLLRSNWIA